MRSALIDDSLWFWHKDGRRLYPWRRHSSYHGLRSLWVSDGSNHIRDAIAIDSVGDLIREVFGRGRSVWLFDGGVPGRGGLYRFGHDAVVSWGAVPDVAHLAHSAGAPAPR